MFLEPSDHGVEGGVYLLPVLETVRGDGEVLVPRLVARHVGQQEFARVLVARTEVVGNSGAEKAQQILKISPGFCWATSVHDDRDD